MGFDAVELLEIQMTDDERRSRKYLQNLKRRALIHGMDSLGPYLYSFVTVSLKFKSK